MQLSQENISDYTVKVFFNFKQEKKSYCFALIFFPRRIRLQFPPNEWITMCEITQEFTSRRADPRTPSYSYIYLKARPEIISCEVFLPINTYHRVSGIIWPTWPFFPPNKRISGSCVSAFYSQVS